MQLNFVAFGLNELGIDPLLDEYWPRVQNPMLLNIEKKLDKAKRYVEHRHGTRIQIRESRLRLEDWGLVDQSSESAQTPKDAPDLTFMSTFPESGSCTPIKLKFGDFVISYYENPKTLGENYGMPSFFTYPQVAIVDAPGETDSQLAVRVENSGFGIPMLCSLDTAGTHRNFGEWSQTDRDSFVSRSVEIASQWRSLQSPPSADQNPQKVVITCPSCRSSLRVPKFRSGKIRCPSCQNLFEVTT